MPKPKPTQVIRHEIVFGRKEKEMLDSVMSAYTFNRVSSPIVELMNDKEGMAVLLSVLATTGLAGTAFAFLVDDNLSVAGLVDSFFTQRQQAIVSAGLEYGSLFDPLGIAKMWQSLLGLEPEEFGLPSSPLQDIIS